MTLDDLQLKLQYQFRDPALLELALTHKSFATTNNERLEFLGDAVLGYVAATLLYRSGPTFSEKDMSLARAHLVRGTTLAEIAAELDLGACLRMGSGELKSGGRQRRSILADALEAVLGAVHEDGGIGACEQLIERLLAERIATLDIRSLKDAKTRLQEYLQGAQRSLPVYEVVDTYGADHAREYRIACVLDDGTRVEARSSSRRKAEKDAARLMLAELGVEQ